MRPAWNGIRGKGNGGEMSMTAWPGTKCMSRQPDDSPEIQYVTMDAGYKQPWIAKRILEDGRLPILPYTRPHGTRREGFMPWDFSYEGKKTTG